MRLNLFIVANKVQLLPELLSRNGTLYVQNSALGTGARQAMCSSSRAMLETNTFPHLHKLASMWCHLDVCSPFLDYDFVSVFSVPCCALRNRGPLLESLRPFRVHLQFGSQRQHMQQAFFIRVSSLISKSLTRPKVAKHHGQTGNGIAMCEDPFRLPE